MIQPASEVEWQRFVSQISKAHSSGEPVLPAHIPYCGVIHCAADYILPDTLLAGLRQWLYARGETRILYFLTETAPSQGEDNSFYVDLWDLTEDTLHKVNTGFESVLTSLDFSWAVFVDHVGTAHVAGPIDLYRALLACTEGSNELAD